MALINTMGIIIIQTGGHCCNCIHFFSSENCKNLNRISQEHILEPRIKILRQEYLVTEEKCNILVSNENLKMIPYLWPGVEGYEPRYKDRCSFAPQSRF